MGPTFLKVLWCVCLTLLLGAVFFPFERRTDFRLGSSVDMILYSNRSVVDRIAQKIGWRINSDRLSRVSILASSRCFDFDLGKLNLAFRDKLNVGYSTQGYFVVDDGSGSDVTTFFITIKPKSVNLDIGTMAEEYPIFSQLSY